MHVQTDELKVLRDGATEEVTGRLIGEPVPAR
jgi:hypothetical protein